jgi:hypothetical protein
MRVLLNIVGSVALAGVAALAALVLVTPAAHAEGSDGDGHSSGSSLIGLHPGFGDSLLEVDRTLNLNFGGGSSGSDNEGGD